MALQRPRRHRAHAVRVLRARRPDRPGQHHHRRSTPTSTPTCRSSACCASCSTPASPCSSRSVTSSRRTSGTRSSTPSSPQRPPRRSPQLRAFPASSSTEQQGRLALVEFAEMVAYRVDEVKPAPWRRPTPRRRPPPRHQLAQRLPGMPSIASLDHDGVADRQAVWQARLHTDLPAAFGHADRRHHHRPTHRFRHAPARPRPRVWGTLVGQPARAPDHKGQARPPAAASRGAHAGAGAPAALHLWVLDVNEPAKRFYSRVGRSSPSCPEHFGGAVVASGAASGAIRRSYWFWADGDGLPSVLAPSSTPWPCPYVKA